MSHPLKIMTPGDVAWAFDDGREGESGLFPEEFKSITRAIEKRRHEFAAGRRAARAALQQLGLPAVALPADEFRVPTWPAQVVGSIAHSGHHYVAVAAKKGRISALGLDVEMNRSYEQAIRDRLASEEEWSAWHRVSQDLRHEPSHTAGAVFVAKEALYKAVYPHTHEFLEFHDVELEFVDHESFSARVINPKREKSQPLVDLLTGRLYFGENAWWALVWSRTLDQEWIKYLQAELHEPSTAESNIGRNPDTA